jgi:hypothetical protein
MDVVGDYHEQGYAYIRGLIPKEVARAFMSGIKQDMGSAAIPLSRAAEYPAVLKRPAFEVYGHVYKPMNFFLWALTPVISRLVGRDLLPTYDYFRIYRQGDICRVHSDRPACEHSVSLTLDYSDGRTWDLQVGHYRIESLHPLAEDFGSKPYASIGMEAGDAVLYQGAHYGHGRITPNPNRWSAHLFLHYVDREGPYAAEAFDHRQVPGRVDFSFA